MNTKKLWPKRSRNPKNRKKQIPKKTKSNKSVHVYAEFTRPEKFKFWAKHYSVTVVSIATTTAAYLAMTACIGPEVATIIIDIISTVAAASAFSWVLLMDADEARRSANMQVPVSSTEKSIRRVSGYMAKISNINFFGVKIVPVIAYLVALNAIYGYFL